MLRCKKSFLRTRKIFDTSNRNEKMYSIWS